jgi:predicted RNase H-like HicB family nuclease
MLKMNEKALNLSERKYLTVIRLEQTTDGGYCYIAFHPELPGCMSQGDTPEEAEANLAEARQMVIEHLLANGLSVPDSISFSSAFTETQLLDQGTEKEFKFLFIESGDVIYRDRSLNIDVAPEFKLVAPAIQNKVFIAG